MQIHSLSLLLFAVLLIAGCTTNQVDVVLKATPQISNFLSQYPNAKITTNLVEQDSVSSHLDSIKQFCGNNDFPVSSYYKTVLNDKDSGVLLTVWVDSKSFKVVCAVKENIGVISAMPTTPQTMTTPQTTITGYEQEQPSHIEVSTIPGTIAMKYCKPEFVEISMNIFSTYYVNVNEHQYKLHLSSIRFENNSRISRISIDEVDGDYTVGGNYLVGSPPLNLSVDVIGGKYTWVKIGSICPQIATSDCADTDSGGKIPTKQGVVIDIYGNKFNDECSDPGRFKNYFCNKGLAEYNILNCRRGCISGFCYIPASAPTTTLSGTSNATTPTTTQIAIASVATTTSSGATTTSSATATTQATTTTSTATAITMVQTTTPTQKSKCVDTDNDAENPYNINQYYIKGEVPPYDNIEGRFDCCKTQWSSDSGDAVKHIGPGGGPCVSRGLYLYEAICKDGIPSVTTFGCPTYKGFLCKEGRCVEGLPDLSVSFLDNWENSYTSYLNEYEQKTWTIVVDNWVNQNEIRVNKSYHINTVLYKNGIFNQQNVVNQCFRQKVEPSFLNFICNIDVYQGGNVTLGIETTIDLDNGIAEEDETNNVNRTIVKFNLT